MMCYTQQGAEPRHDRKAFMDLVLKPRQEKKEPLYVLPNSAAKEHAERRFPHKQVKVVDSGIRGL